MVNHPYINTARELYCKYVHSSEILNYACIVKEILVNGLIQFKLICFLRAWCKRGNNKVVDLINI